MRENHTMNFINEHVSIFQRIFFNTPCLTITNGQNQLARTKVAGHVFINEIHSVVFPHFRVILRTDRPMALCQTLSPAPKKGERVSNERLPSGLVRGGVVHKHMAYSTILQKHGHNDTFLQRLGGLHKSFSRQLASL